MAKSPPPALQTRSLLADDPPTQPDWRPIVACVGMGSLLLFLCSGVRHAILHSNAFDLAIFDQAVYLISRGLPPISSILGYHILGDHAAWVFYLLAPFYRLYPSVYWLLGLQAVGLSLGALAIYALARQSNLRQGLSLALSAVYLLHPLVFNINLFDFHTDVFAPAALLAAVWAARANRIGWFSLLVLLLLSLKAVLALTLVALGLWLWIFENKRSYGLIALMAGTVWFLLATQWIIPHFSGVEARALDRYSEFGSTPLQIAANLFLKPGLVLHRLFTLPNLWYLVQLALPVVWGLSLRALPLLVGALPTLVMNLITEFSGQKTLLNQYSLPILPFLLLMAIATLAAQPQCFQAKWVKWAILSWAVAMFLAFAHYSMFGSYFKTLDTWQATRSAIAQIPAQSSVLTDDNLAAQVSHRAGLYLIRADALERNLAKSDYVLLNLRHPEHSQRRPVRRLARRLRCQPEFQLRYSQNQVVLFQRRSVHLP